MKPYVYLSKHNSESQISITLSLLKVYAQILIQRKLNNESVKDLKFLIMVDPLPHRKLSSKVT